MIVNLKCSECNHVYNFDIGEPSLDKNCTLVFENDSVCPACKVRGKDLLTELGQFQMTAWHLGGI